MSDEMKTLQDLQSKINEQKTKQAKLQNKEKAMNLKQEELWQKSFDDFKEKALELKDYLPLTNLHSGKYANNTGVNLAISEKNYTSSSGPTGRDCHYTLSVGDDNSVYIGEEAGGRCFAETYLFFNVTKNTVTDKNDSFHLGLFVKQFSKVCYEQNLPEKITGIVKEYAQKNLESLTKQNEELSNKIERRGQNPDKETENASLKNADTADLIKELKGREDVLFVAAYTKNTIKERLRDIGWENLAEDDKFVKEVIKAVDKNELEDSFQDWENEEFSAYDKLTDVVNEKVMDEDERNLQDEIFRKQAEKCFDILEANTPWSVLDRNPEVQKHRDATTYVYEIETETSFGQDVVENIMVDVDDFRENLEQFPNRDDHFANAFLEDLKEAYENYDPSEETSLWLDGTGHGKNGAPYAMKDVLKDMEEAKKMIGDAYKTMSRIYSKHEKNKDKKVTPESMGKEFLEKYEKNLAEKINYVPHENRKFHLMGMTKKDVLSFENGDVEIREKMLEEYLDRLGVKNKEFKFLDENDRYIPKEEINSDEQKIDGALEAMLRERSEKIKSIKSNAKSALHGVNIDKTLREAEEKKKQKKQTVSLEKDGRGL